MNVTTRRILATWLSAASETFDILAGASRPKRVNPVRRLRTPPWARELQQVHARRVEADEPPEPA